MKGKGILFLLLLSFVPFLWLKKGLLIAGGDEYSLLDPGTLAPFLRYAWNIKLTNAGGVIFSIPKLIPMSYFWAFFESLGLSLVTIERLWMILLFGLPGFSMYYLMSIIYNKGWAKIVSSVLYMFNLFIIAAGPFQSNIKPILIALPLMLAFLIKGLNQEKDNLLKYPLLIGLSSLIYAGTNVNPPAVAIVPMVLGLYFLYFVFFLKGNLLKSLKFALVTVASYLLLNLWWLMNFFVSIAKESAGIKGVITFVALAGSGELSDFFRLLGSWGWRSGHHLMHYYPFFPNYDKPFLLILSFSITILVFLAIFLRPKDKNVRFFGILVIVGLFLAKGAMAPLGFLYQWIYLNIPGFWTFREPFAKFTPITVLAYSVLLGYSTEILSQKIKNSRKIHVNSALILSIFFPVSIIAVILIVAYPLLNGEVIWDHWNGSMRSLYTQTPEYWKQAKNWFNQNDKEARIFLTPKGGYGVAYNWEHGFSTADAPAIVLLDNPIFRAIPPISEADKVVNQAYKTIDPKRGGFVKLMSILNTKYILQQNDLDWNYTYPTAYSPDKMKDILSDLEGITFMRSFGRLDLYRLEDRFYLPHFYVAKDVTFISNSSLRKESKIEAFLDVVSLQEFNERPGIYVKDFNDKLPNDMRPEEIFVKGNLENGFDENYFEEKRKLEKDWLNLPPSHDPGSLLHSLALKKEAMQEWSIKHNRNELINRKLFHAGIRIKELAGMIANGKTQQTKEFEETLLRYSKKMEEAISLIKLLDQGTEKSSLFTKLKLGVDFYKKQIGVLLNEGKIQPSALTLKVFNNLDQETDKIGREYNPKDLEYVFEVPQEGDYRLFIDQSDNDFLKKTKVEIGSEQLDANPKAMKEGWVELGEKNLKAGKQEITLILPEGENLIGTDWKKMNESLYYQPVKKWQMDANYFLTFEYNVLGSFFEAGLLRDNGTVEKGQKVLIPEFFFSENLSTSDWAGWKKYEKFFAATEGTKDANLYFVLRPNAKNEADIQLKNVAVFRIYQPKLVLKLKDTFQTPPKTAEPELTFSMINPTKYTVSIKRAKEPYLLVFSESFHQGWKAYVKGKTPVLENNHLLVNGYANSWYITPDLVGGRQDYELILEFWPQRLFNKGAFISGIVFIGSIGFFLLISLKKRKYE